MFEEWKTRTAMLVGEVGIHKLESSAVAVAGVGGVGAYAAEMLVRAGVGKLLIIDSDNVSVTNKNRQLLALDSTLGHSKCEVMSKRLKDINPDLQLLALDVYIESEKVEEILGGYQVNFVVDAIDTLGPKLSLIKYCMDRKIPLVSSMGAGAKFDVTKIRVADVSKSFNCPLAYMVRKKLRKMGISKGFKVVFSEELPDENAIVACEERNKKSQVGTISYLPAVFGCACAQVVITTLLNKI